MFLEQFDLFQSFSASELARLARAMQVQTYSPGHVFTEEGSPVDPLLGGMYLILRGTVSVSAEGPHGDEDIKTMTAGEVFGMIALIGGNKRGATCVAKNQVEAAFLGHLAFKILYKSDADVATRFQLMVAQQVARDIRHLYAQLRDAVLHQKERGLRTTLRISKSDL